MSVYSLLTLICPRTPAICQGGPAPPDAQRSLINRLLRSLGIRKGCECLSTEELDMGKLAGCMGLLHEDSALDAYQQAVHNMFVEFWPLVAFNITSDGDSAVASIKIMLAGPDTSHVPYGTICCIFLCSELARATHQLYLVMMNKVCDEIKASSNLEMLQADSIVITCLNKTKNAIKRALLSCQSTPWSARLKQEALS